MPPKRGGHKPKRGGSLIGNVAKAVVHSNTAPGPVHTPAPAKTDRYLRPPRAHSPPPSPSPVIHGRPRGHVTGRVVSHVPAPIPEQIQTVRELAKHEMNEEQLRQFAKAACQIPGNKPIYNSGFSTYQFKIIPRKEIHIWYKKNWLTSVDILKLEMDWPYQHEFGEQFNAFVDCLIHDQLVTADALEQIKTMVKVNPRFSFTGSYPRTGRSWRFNDGQVEDFYEGHKRQIVEEIDFNMPYCRRVSIGLERPGLCVPLRVALTLY